MDFTLDMPEATIDVPWDHVFWQCYNWPDPETGIWCNEVNRMTKAFCARCSSQRDVYAVALDMYYTPIGTLKEITNGNEIWEYWDPLFSDNGHTHNDVDHGADQSPDDSNNVNAAPEEPHASSGSFIEHDNGTEEITNGLQAVSLNDEELKGFGHTAEPDLDNDVNGSAEDEDMDSWIVI